MAVQIKNGIIFIGTVLGIMIFIFSCIMVWKWIFADQLPDTLAIQNSQQWFLFQFSGENSAPHSVRIISILAQGIIACIIQILLWILFRHAHSTEHIVFFSIFIVTMMIATLRVLQIPLAEAPIGYSTFIRWSGTISRVVHFTYIMGRISLLFASLYLIAGKYRNAGTVLGSTVLLITILVSALPIDTLQLFPNFIHPLHKISNIHGISIAIAGLACINIIYSIINKKSKYVTYILIGIACCIGGTEIWFNANSLAMIAVGGGLTSASLIFTIWQNYVWNLWH